MHAKHANLYINNAGDTAIVASCYNHGAASAEIEGSAVCLETRNKLELGAIVKEKLNESVYKKHFNYSKNTKKDWPAFIASGIKTVKSFESDFTQYHIRGISESNLYFEVVSPKLNNCIELRLTFSAKEIELQIGIELLMIHSYYHQCK